HLPLLQDRLEEALERTPNLRWQDASGEATSESASAPKVSRPNRTKKAKKNNKTKGSKGDFPEESAEDAEEDAAEEDVQGALGRRDGRSRNRYPVAFGAARMAAMLAGDPTIDVLEIDDVLGRPITFERGTLEPPTPPSAISSKAPGLEVESAAKLPEPLEVGGEFDALEVAAGENKREEEKKEKKEKKDNEPTAKDPRAERGSSDSIDPYESSDSEGGDLSARGDGPGDGLGGLGGVEAKREPAEDQEQRRIVADSNPDEAHDSEKEPAHSEELEFEDRPEPELLFAATATMPASHTELFEAEGDGATAHFFLREGPRDRYALGEHVLRGRQLIDVTFNVDINGILGLSFRKNFRGKEAQLYVLGGGGMPSEEVQALAAEERTKEEVLRKRRRTQELTLRLRGLHERGSKVLSELQAGIPEGDRIQLQATLQAMHDAVVAGSLEALETANSRLIELLGELPRAIQEAITTPIATETPVAVASS
ncbi:MAG TPA: hypothetical protein ENK31_00075, partial [Nannocystis exedens]|nr:hypothetical protein [Nannocystis exedens]